MFFVAALVICLVIKFRFPKGKSIARMNFINHMNGIQVTNFHNRSTEPLNYRIYARP